MHWWKPAGGQAVHTLPRHSVSLTPLPQHPKPQAIHLILESVEFPLITRHSIVLEVASHYRP